MTPEERSLLERTYKLVEENNTILKMLRRSHRIGVAVKVLYWVVIIGVSVGAFYFIQPYVNFLSETFGGTTNASSAGMAPSQSQQTIQTLQDLLR